MLALAIDITPSDTRYFKVTPEYKIGHYTEGTAPGTDQNAPVLVIARVPTGTRPALGRQTPAELQALADQELAPRRPEVIARYQYWNYVRGDGVPVEVPDDTVCEQPVVLPPTVWTRDGAPQSPPNAYTPLSASIVKETRGVLVPDKSAGKASAASIVKE